jgi:hypothetical protein
VAAVALTGALVLSPELRAVVGVLPPDDLGYRAGDELDLRPDGVSSANRTAVLFMRSSCSACQDAVPGLKRLVADVSQTADAQVLMVIRQSSSEDEFALAESLGIPPSHVVPADLRRLRLRRVPAVVIVDRNRKVLFAMSGVPSESDIRTAVQFLTTQ